MNRKPITFVLSSIAGMLIFVTELGAFAIHVWTTAIGYQHTGFFGAVLTFVLPFVSEAYWFRYAWKAYGFLGSWYNVAVVVLVVAWLCWVAVGMLIARLDRATGTPEHGWTICDNCGAAFEEGPFCPECHQ
jgi:hypothetical protein